MGNSKEEWLTETGTDMKTLMGNTEYNYSDTINTAQGKDKLFSNIAGCLAFTTIERA